MLLVLFLVHSCMPQNLIYLHCRLLLFFMIVGSVHLEMTAGDEDAVKKDTDCVYFLASPLTCKKGNDCEFRHSENARLNPRDCWYWLQGNCLNRDCAFRHPPIEGRSAPPSLSPLSTSASTSKPPCYYYSQGYCAKGDRCPFLHGKPPLLSLPVSASPKPMNVSVKGIIEPQDKHSTKTEVTTLSAKTDIAMPMLTMKLTSTLGKANSHLAKPSNVWRLSADPQTQVSLAPDKKDTKADMTKSMSPNSSGHPQIYKRSSDVLGRDLAVREESFGPKSNATWLRQEPTTLGKDQDAKEHQEQLKISNNRIESSGNGPRASIHPKGFVLSKSEDTRQDLNAGRHMPRQVTHPVVIDVIQNPGIFESRADIYTRVAFDSAGSDEDNEHSHASHDWLQHVRYSDDMNSSLRSFTQDTHRTEQDYWEGQESVEMKVRASPGVHDLRNHLVKRRRLDEAKPVSENLPSVHVSEKVFNNLKQSRQQLRGEQSVDAYEKRLFAIHDTRLSNRRGLEMDVEQGDKMRRRSSHYGSDDHNEEIVQKEASKNSRMPSVYDNLKNRDRGLDDVEVSMLSDASAVGEGRTSVSRSRKSEVPKEVSDFAGPKSLAQIKAEKENMGFGKEIDTGGSLQTMTDHPHCKTPEVIKSKIQVKPSTRSPHFDDEGFFLNGKMPRDDVLVKGPFATAENGKQSATSKRELQSIVFADEHLTRSFLKESVIGNSQGKLPCVSGETRQVKAEDGDIPSLEVRAALATNGSELQTFRGKVHAKEFQNAFYRENLEELYGKPGDEIAITEEEEDDFARKLGGYFS